MALNNVLSATIGFFIMDLNIKNFACNGCHDWRMLRLHFRNIAIIMVKGVDYDCLTLANIEQLIYLWNYDRGKIYIWKNQRSQRIQYQKTNL